MSFTATILPILAALNVAQDKLHIDTWVPTNAEQRVLMEHYYPKRHELQKLLPQELSSIASKDIDEVNTFLKTKGFDIQLDKNKANPNDVAVASILDIALKWKIPGEKSWITVLGDGFGNYLCPAELYPAVRMNSAYSIRKSSNEKIVIAIDTENGDTVYISLAEKSLKGFELFNEIRSLSSQNYKDVTTNFSGILFPMIDINQQVDISWLRGLDSSMYFIAQALQQTRFQMDEKGAAVQSAVAVHAVYKSIQTPKPILEINQPFYLWIERPGMSMPLFAAYIDYTDWKEPKSIITEGRN